MVGRGVLLDVARYQGKHVARHRARRSRPPTSRRCARQQGVEVGEGDFVLVRTGQMAQRRQRRRAGATTPAARRRASAISAADFFCPRNVAAVATDTWGTEVLPNETPDVFQPLHIIMLVNAGIHLGEMWDMEELAADCAEDGVYEFHARRAAADDHRLGRLAGQPASDQVMKPAPFRYQRTTTVEETVAALAAAPGRARVLAGGQSLVAELCARTTSAEVLVDIAGVAALDHVAIDADVVRIGALRRIAAVEDDAELAAALPALVECAARIAHPAVRNRGTIGGNVAHADPASGVPPVLLAHDGEVVLSGPSGSRAVAATAFFTGHRTTACGPDELVTELRFRRPGPRGGAAFYEVSRRARGWGLAGACAVVPLDEGGRIARGADRPARARAHRRARRGRRGGRRRPGAGSRGARRCRRGRRRRPHRDPGDVHASPTLRRNLGRVAVRRALTEAVSGRARGSDTNRWGR